MQSTIDEYKLRYVRRTLDSPLIQIWLPCMCRTTTRPTHELLCTRSWASTYYGYVFASDFLIFPHGSGWIQPPLGGRACSQNKACYIRDTSQLSISDYPLVNSTIANLPKTCYVIQLKSIHPKLHPLVLEVFLPQGNFPAQLNSLLSTIARVLSQCNAAFGLQENEDFFVSNCHSDDDNVTFFEIHRNNKSMATNAATGHGTDDLRSCEDVFTMDDILTEEDKDAGEDLQIIEESFSLTVKATCRDKTAKFPLSNNSVVEELNRELGKRFKLEVGRFNIKYKDGDGEWIGLFCNEDLQFYVKTLKASDESTLKLEIDPIDEFEIINQFQGRTKLAGAAKELKVSRSTFKHNHPKIGIQRHPSQKINASETCTLYEGITLDNINQYLGLSLANAAKKMNISISTLKRKCRTFGITRWPSKRNKASGIQSRTGLPTAIIVEDAPKKTNSESKNGVVDDWPEIVPQLCTLSVNANWEFAHHVRDPSSREQFSTFIQDIKTNTANSHDVFRIPVDIAVFGSKSTEVILDVVESKDWLSKIDNIHKDWIAGFQMDLWASFVHSRLPKEDRGRIHIINTNSSFISYQSDNQEKINQEKITVANRLVDIMEENKAKLYVMPICRAKHWMMLFIVPEESVVYCIDSLKAGITSSVRPSEHDFLMRVGGVYDSKVRPQEVKNWKIVNIIHKVQPQSWECGYYNMLYMEKIVLLHTDIDVLKVFPEDYAAYPMAVIEGVIDTFCRHVMQKIAPTCLHICNTTRRKAKIISKSANIIMREEDEVTTVDLEGDEAQNLQIIEERQVLSRFNQEKQRLEVIQEDMSQISREAFANPEAPKICLNEEDVEALQAPLNEDILNPSGDNSIEQDVEVAIEKQSWFKQEKQSLAPTTLEANDHSKIIQKDMSWISREASSNPEAEINWDVEDFYIEPILIDDILNPFGDISIEQDVDVSIENHDGEVLRSSQPHAACEAIDHSKSIPEDTVGASWEYFTNGDAKIPFVDNLIREEVEPVSVGGRVLQEYEIGQCSKNTEVVSASSIPESVKGNSTTALANPDFVQGFLLTVKATYGGDTAKFHFHSSSGIEELNKILGERFKLEVWRFKIYYMDEDGDWIIMSRNDDLLFHIETLKASGQSTVRLTIFPVTICDPSV